MNRIKKSRGKCMTCPESEVYPKPAAPEQVPLCKLRCKMKPEMKIDFFTRQPDWCPLKTEMQTPIELPKVPDEIEKLEEMGVEFVN